LKLSFINSVDRNFHFQILLCKELAMKRLAIGAAIVFAAGFIAVAEEHHAAEQQTKVEINNDQVIVRRYIHQPHSTTPMHSHRPGVVVYLSGVHERSTLADGSSKEVFHKPGDVVWAPARQHTLENLGSTPIEAIEIELKDR
jgi:beta-alanine degradation protein BauB